MDLSRGSGGTFEDGSDSTNDTDCHWRNCTLGSQPDWGVSGNPDDDPALLLDDVTGTGLEVIGIPAPANGTYTVAVHDYPGSSFEDDNNSTLEVLVNGVNAFSENRTIRGEDTVQQWAVITWSGSSATVQSVSGDPP